MRVCRWLNTASAALETIEGSVTRVVFRALRSHFTVLELRVEPIAAGEGARVGRRRATKAIVTGTCPTVPEEGAFVRARGVWRDDARHGVQLAAEQLDQITPTSPEAAERYLRCFKGVGPKRARALAAAYPNVFEVLERSPQQLLSVKGFGRAALSKLEAEWRARRASHHAAAYLHSVGIGPAVAERLVARLGGTPESCAAALQSDPYAVVAQSGDLLSFPRADALALEAGVARDDARRVREALVHSASQLALAGGHTNVHQDELCAHSLRLLGLASSPEHAVLVSDQLAAVVSAGRLVRVADQLLSPADLHAAELAIARALGSIIRAPHPLPWVDPESFVRSAEKRFGGASTRRLEAMQAEAIRQVMSRKVVVVTGGPGVGKTTAISSIVASYRHMGLTTVVASPTGRASAKLSQVTGQVATTLHRLLEYDPALGGFKRNAENKLQGNLFLIDEASMVDAQLAASFLAAVPARAVVVFVGDVDQLPAIGAGNVLKDLVQCGAIPTVRLDRIFRQKERESHIVRAAYAMLEGTAPVIMPYDVGSGLETLDTFVNESDLRFITAPTPAKVMESVVRVIDDLRARHNVHPLDDIQVLTAMRKGPLGSRSFNAVLQRRYNASSSSPPLDAAALYAPPQALFSFRVGDKVMQIVNDYDKDVFNGEIGRIDAIGGPDGVVRVRFPVLAGGSDDGTAHRIVSYTPEQLRDLEPSFACTIHKAQGGEFPVVIVPVHPCYAHVLQRNLLYTGITRASRLCVIVGTMDCVRQTVARKDSTMRRSSLKRLLEQELLRTVPGKQ